MGKSKKIIIGTVAGVTAAAVCVSGVLVWHHHSKSSSVDGVAYVMPIRDVNSAANTVSDLQFSGVVESHLQCQLDELLCFHFPTPAV